MSIYFLFRTILPQQKIGKGLTKMKNENDCSYKTQIVLGYTESFHK